MRTIRVEYKINTSAVGELLERRFVLLRTRSTDENVIWYDAVNRIIEVEDVPKDRFTIVGFKVV